MLYLDRKPVTAGRFPNGETYVDLDRVNALDPDLPHEVCMKFEGNDDLIDLMLLKRALDDAGISKVRLIAPCFPYSTMDRTEGVRALSCKYVSEFINLLKFTQVEIWEAHSSVVLATLDRVRNDSEKTARIARTVIQTLVAEGKAPHELVVVFPDGGAAKRYGKQFCDLASVTLEKERNFSDGRITGVKVSAPIPPELRGKTAVIVDDLCRAGGTFVAAGAELKRLGAERVILCVTHTEDGIYHGGLLDGEEVDAVYTTDSCFTYRPHEKLHLVEKILKEENER